MKPPEPIQEVLSLAHEGRRLCEAAAAHTFDDRFRNELVTAARDQHELAEMLTSAVGYDPKSAPAVQLTTAVEAALAGAACDRLGDASIASTLLPVERELGEACRRAGAVDGLAAELRDALRWAAEKSGRRVEQLEKHAHTN